MDAAAMRRALVPALAVALFFEGSAAHAQAGAYTFCAGEGGVCKAPAGSLVRYGEPWGNRWSADRAMPASGEIACNNATFGDPSPGTGKRCEWRAGSQPPPQPPATGGASLRVMWAHATQNTDGSALADRTGYRIERAGEESGPWETLATVTTDATSAQALVPLGRSCVRVLTLAQSGESIPSAAVCVQKLAPTVAPLPPGDVGASFAELSLVSGTETRTRAVWQRTSAGSRGAKIGDVTVGPVAQTDPPIDRVRCNVRDSFTAGGVRYSRIIDPRVGENLRAGYVSGCVSYGNQ